MAELAALKGKRLTAQALFSKRAKKLSLTVDLLGKRALIDEIRTLGVDFEKVHDTGLEYIDALGEVEKAEEEAAHAEEKTAKCLDTYTDTLRLAKETLWFKFAYVKIKLYVDGTEEKCAEVEYTDVKELPEEDCQVLRESLEERISMLERKVLEWETIVSEAKTTVYKQQLYNLGNRLHDWVQSWKKLKRTEELDGGEEAAPAVPNFPHAPPQSIPGMNPGVYGFRPQISLERTRLPTFSGDMTDYYRWKAEWEELEQLGNPQRTAGVTRFHLLASLSDRVKKALVLSSCASADEIFRRLDNHFGNKEEVQALLPGPWELQVQQVSPGRQRDDPWRRKGVRENKGLPLLCASRQAQ